MHFVYLEWRRDGKKHSASRPPGRNEPKLLQMESELALYRPLNILFANSIPSILNLLAASSFCSFFHIFQSFYTVPLT